MAKRKTAKAKAHPRVSLRTGIPAPKPNPPAPTERAEQRKFAQRNLQRVSTRDNTVPADYKPIDTQNAGASPSAPDPEAALYDTSFRDSAITAARQRMNAVHRPSGSEGAPPVHSPFADGPKPRQLRPGITTNLDDAAGVYELAIDEDLDDENRYDADAALPEFSSGVASRSITLHDIDRLWDWVREDPDAGKAFLGRAFDSSLALHAAIKDIYLQQHEGTAAMFSIDVQLGPRFEHAGFVFLLPLDAAAAHVHLFLAPFVRGRLAELAPQLLEVASRAYPSVKLVVITDDPVKVRLYKRFGFTASSVLTREATHGYGPRNGHVNRDHGGPGNRGDVRAGGAGTQFVSGDAGRSGDADVDPEGHDIEPVHGRGGPSQSTR